MRSAKTFILLCSKFEPSEPLSGTTMCKLETQIVKEDVYETEISYICYGKSFTEETEIKSVKVF
jgi:hypothetical protein